MFDTRRMAVTVVALMTAARAAGAGEKLVRKTASGSRPEPTAITPDEILGLYRN